MRRPSKHYNEGFNCAESMIQSYNEEHNTDIPISLGSGMGSGATIGSLCGAMNAAITIIGYLKGRTNKTEINLAKNYSEELMTLLKEKYDSELCSDLKIDKASCGKMLDFIYDSLNEVLED